MGGARGPPYSLGADQDCESPHAQAMTLPMSVSWLSFVLSGVSPNKEFQNRHSTSVHPLVPRTSPAPMTPRIPTPLKPRRRDMHLQMPKVRKQQSPPFPFYASRLRKLCKRKLGWTKQDVLRWITNHTLPYLRHWKLTCYDDPTMRSIMHKQLSHRTKRRRFRRKVFKLCVQHSARLWLPQHFEGLTAGPSRHVARTAVDIHLLCFSRVQDWTAMFAQHEDGGYKIAVQLVLDVFLDLYRRGGNGYFDALLADGRSQGVTGTDPRVSSTMAIGNRGRQNSRANTGNGRSNDNMPNHSDEGKRAGSMSPMKANKDQKKSSGMKQERNAAYSPPQKRKSGQGSRNTRKHNARVREEKKLRSLKRVNVLPEDADLADLRQRKSDLKRNGSKAQKKKSSSGAEGVAEATMAAPAGGDGDALPEAPQAVGGEVAGLCTSQKAEKQNGCSDNGGTPATEADEKLKAHEVE
ncbi:hypothetical protein LTR37_013410 [Vermiconidia calcicola]|uniref:Uncharacterized protein n=1 Tax=Vermiconidia calcicola TaxID=1690605 RepID=A0ACC3MY44_9PEZI|nr:hypothetical protein LTR37_013410 [Vermiconidia calcicola]